MHSPTGSRLQLQGIHKQFEHFSALRDINLDIQPGELVCFLGPSGCGKTTLLRIIAGLETQTSGRLLQGENDISNLPPRQRDFGIVFQSYALFPNLSVHDNIAFGLRSQRLPKAKIQARVDELLDLIGLREQARKYPAQLSGGQQQRVALARALAPAPGLLLLDEPLSALDAHLRVHLQTELARLHRELKITFIYVTHSQSEAFALADRVVVMADGIVQQAGAPRDVYRAPVNGLWCRYALTKLFSSARHRFRIPLRIPYRARGRPLFAVVQLLMDVPAAPIGGVGEGPPGRGRTRMSPRAGGQ